MLINKHTGFPDSGDYNSEKDSCIHAASKTADSGGGGGGQRGFPLAQNECRESIVYFFKKFSFLFNDSNIENNYDSNNT